MLTDWIIESITPLKELAVRSDADVLDVGSGAGIPGLPLKFALPDIRLTLLEPKRKKAAFLRRAVDELKLKNVKVVCQRVEEVSLLEEWGRSFDLATTRGTGNALHILPYIAPLVKPGGSVWFYKGKKTKREAEELNRAAMSPIRIVKISDKLSVISVEVK